ncbi:MAG: hypothetical protein ACW981_15705 [Candidatus Hodarchaeales archaeon]|jgi:hypothetical protein
MATTVQLNKKTKEELLIVKARLEQETGKKHSLDDAIRWLIEKERSPSVEERLKTINESFGVIKDLEITLDELTNLRKERSSRFEDI